MIDNDKKQLHLLVFDTWLGEFFHIQIMKIILRVRSEQTHLWRQHPPDWIRVLPDGTGDEKPQ